MRTALEPLAPVGFHACLVKAYLSESARRLDSALAARGEEWRALARREYADMSEARYQKTLRKRRERRARETQEQKEARRKKFREYQRAYRARKREQKHKIREKVLKKSVMVFKIDFMIGLTSWSPVGDTDYVGEK